MGIRVSQKEPLIAIYGWWQACKGEPLDRVPLFEARRLEDEGLAKTCRRGTALQLLKEQWKWDIRGESCHPGPELMLKFALGMKRAIAAIESWA